MAIDPKLFETDDTTDAVEIAFGELSSGETSATFSKHLWNGKGNPAADTLTGIQLTAYERQVVRDPDTNEVVEVTAWNQSGRATLEGWIQARYTPSTGVTSWIPVGANRWLALDDLAAEEFWLVELRMVVPGGAISSAEREFRIVVSWDAFSSSVSLGFHEVGQRGVLSGVGDLSTTHLVSGYDATPNSPADTGVDFSDGIAIIAGTPYVDLLHEVTFDGDDGDSAALTTGNEYWATVSKGPQSGLTVTKSAQGAAPLANTLRPAVPAGERLVAYVRRHFDAVIEAADIYQDVDTELVRFFGRFFLGDISGLNATIHPGESALDNRLITRTGTQIATLTDDATNTIWLDPLTGGLFVTIGTNDPPVARSLPLWQVVMASAAEVSRTDLRTYVGAREVQVFRAEKLGTLAATDVVGQYYLPPGTDWALRIPYGVMCAVDDTGTTGGQTIFDLETSEAGGAWTTVFTSQGVAATDRRPTIAFDATDPVDAGGLAEVVVIPGNTRLRWIVDEIPTGASSDALCLAILEALSRS